MAPPDLAPSDVTCPSCCGETRVLDTRERADGAIKRRRKCAGCGGRFSTLEQPAESMESDPGGTLDQQLDEDFDLGV